MFESQATGEQKIQPPANLRMYLAGLVAIVVLGPTVIVHFIGFEASFWHTQIVAMIWAYMADSYGSTLYTVFTQPLFFMLLPLLVIPRLYFISMISKLYNEKTSRKRVVRVGIISEIWLPLVYYVPLLPFLIISPWVVGGIPIAVPIPFLFIAGMFMLRRIPARGLPSTWTGDDDSVNWWEDAAQ